MPDRPDIILICTDQQRADSLGCSGNPGALTPNLDALAAAGTTYRRCFTANAVCMPSRASILTGFNPSAHGVWTNGVPLPRRGYIAETSSAGGGLPPGASAVSQVDTLADLLATAGYATTAVGKLHLTPTAGHPSLGHEECRRRWDEHELDDWHGPYYGFEHVDLSIGHGVRVTGHYGRWLEEHFPDVARNVADWRGEALVPGVQLFDSPVPIEAHHSIWCGERAAANIAAADPDQPLFLWVGLPDPHHPFAPPREALDLVRDRPVQPPRAPSGDFVKPSPWQPYLVSGSGWACPAEAVASVRRATDAMLHLVDRAVGRIVDALQTRGTWNDAVIVFTSDHGDFLGDFGLVYKAGLGAAAMHHVPLLLRAPNAGLPPAVESTVGSIDLLPTLAGLAGTTAPPELQGEDLCEICTSGRRRLVRAEDIPAGGPAGRNHTVYDDCYRYTWFPVTGERELYDHRNDPGETRNLVENASGREIANKLHYRLLQQLAEDYRPTSGRVSIW